MTCKHNNPAESCETCKEHQIYKSASERRKAAGIRLRRVCFMAQESQVAAFNEIWESWVERWGKTAATDHLISIMSRIEASIRNA